MCCAPIQRVPEEDHSWLWVSWETQLCVVVAYFLIPPGGKPTEVRAEEAIVFGTEVAQVKRFRGIDRVQLVVKQFVEEFEVKGVFFCFGWV